MTAPFRSWKIVAEKIGFFLNQGLTKAFFSFIIVNIMKKISQNKRRNPCDNRSVYVMQRGRCFPLEDFPLGVVYSPEQGLLDYHIHENFSELVIITEGTGIHEVNGRSYPVTAGDVFMVQGDYVHCYSDGYGLTLVNVIFNWDELPLPQCDIGEIAAFQHLFVIDPANQDSDRFDRRVRLAQSELNELLRMVGDLDRIINAQPVGAGVRFIALAKFMELIAALLQAYERAADALKINSLPQRLGVLAAMLEQNFMEQISIEKMCRVAGMSYASLFRQFRRYFNDTPGNYLQTQRLRRAGELLLQQPELSISEAAFRCGFTDSAYFSRKFKEYFQVSPSQYRYK